MLTRRCVQRQFLLRPDEKMNNAFIYCLVEAAQMYDIIIILTQMMSNHHHTVLFDPKGNVVHFYQRFHTNLAKCVNALRHHSENVWATKPPSLVELVEADDVVDKIVYTATNPVKDGLVEKMHSWPGPRTVAAMFNDKAMHATRPGYLFRDDGPMPERVELKFEIPTELGDPADVLARVRAGCIAVETAMAEGRARTNRRVLGRRNILRQSWRDAPETVEPRRRLQPRVAARNPSARIEALLRNRQFRVDYRDARARWLAGEHVVFPVGTYWLRWFANVPVESATAH